MFIKFVLESAHVIINIHSTHKVQISEWKCSCRCLIYMACRMPMHQTANNVVLHMRNANNNKRLRECTSARAPCHEFIEGKQYTPDRCSDNYCITFLLSIYLCMWPEMQGDSLEREWSIGIPWHRNELSQSINALWGWWTILIVAIPAAPATKSALDFLRRRLRCADGRQRIDFAFTFGMLMEISSKEKYEENGRRIVFVCNREIANYCLNELKNAHRYFDVKDFYVQRNLLWA